MRLFRRYPGITEIVLNLAINDSEILNLFGCYIHGDNLELTKADISYLKGVVDKFLEKRILGIVKIFTNM